MSAKSGVNLRQFTIFSESVQVTPGSEPAQFLGVDLTGAPSATALGVSNVSRDGFVSVVLLGVMPCKVKDGETIAVGTEVAADANGELIPATALTGKLGTALDSVTTASGDYIEIYVNPSKVLA